MATDENPIYGPFFGVMGAAAAIIFSGKHSNYRKKNLLRKLRKVKGIKQERNHINPIKMAMVLFGWME